MNELESMENLGLTKSEARIALALYEANGHTTSINFLLRKLYPSSVISDMKIVLHDRKQDTWVLSGTRTLRVFLTNIRAKLNIEIHSSYADGYFLPDESIERLRRLVPAKKAVDLGSDTSCAIIGEDFGEAPLPFPI